MSAWSPLRYRVYRDLWIALLAANIGTWMQTIGAAWLMLELGASPALVALVQTATYLPIMLVGVAAGAVADLVNRRRLLLVTQAGMMAAAGGLSVVTAAGWATPPLVLGFTFALGLGTTFSWPAWQAIQPELVPREELQQVFTLASTNINLGRAVGPALGGLLIIAVGPWLVFALNTAALGLFLAAVWRWRPPVAKAEGPPEGFAGAVRAGIRYALYSHALYGVLVRSFAFGLTSASLVALLPVYAKESLGLGSGGLGIFYAALGGGAVASTTMLPALRRRLSADRVFAVGSSVFAVALLMLALVRTPIVAVLVTLAAGVGWFVCIATFTVVSQEVLPAWVRARGMAFHLTAFSAGVALGSALWGFLADFTSVPTAYAWGAFALAAGLPLALRWRFDSIAGFDLSPAPTHVAEGALVGADTDASTLVVVRYEVCAADEEDFLRVLHLIGRGRRRTGAKRWSVYRDAEQEHTYIETYVLSSWDEHLREHLRRTVSEQRLQEDVRRYLRPGTTPAVWHYVAPPRRATRSRGPLRSLAAILRPPM